LQIFGNLLIPIEILRHRCNDQYKDETQIAHASYLIWAEEFRFFKKCIFAIVRPLQSYLDEFVFRFNRRRTRHAAFRSLLGIAANHSPLTYQMLILP
jgi:hypothetical protein